MIPNVTNEAAGQRKRRFPNRWSLRDMIISCPILNRGRQHNTPIESSSKLREKEIDETRKGDSFHKKLREVEVHDGIRRSSSVLSTTMERNQIASSNIECRLCFAEMQQKDFYELATCGHQACINCYQQYLKIEITESRVAITCPECFEPMHPNEIRNILDNSVLLKKYEDFMVRRVLSSEPDTRWCPAPDCSFAVIANECASCPKLKCERPGCDSYFCYHCKAEWHPNQTCDAARAQRSANVRSSSITYSQDSQRGDDIKPCPRCQVLIVKMDDGSCNHMICAVCGAEFCWLCMKEINDLHFLSPSGCTFWGKKPWSRKKKILWQLGTLVGAPVGIALVASITIPAMIIGIPVWIGRKLYTKYKNTNKHQRNATIVCGVLTSVIISPILAGIAVSIGVPILLFYIYGVVPVSLCRSGGWGGLSLDEQTVNRTRQVAINSINTNKVKYSKEKVNSSSENNFFEDANTESTSVAILPNTIECENKRMKLVADISPASAKCGTDNINETANVDFPDDANMSLSTLDGRMLNNQSSGINYVVHTSDKQRFNDNLCLLVMSEKKMSGENSSFHSLRFTNPSLSIESQENHVEIDLKKHYISSQTAVLRRQFFNEISDSVPLSLDRAVHINMFNCLPSLNSSVPNTDLTLLTEISNHSNVEKSSKP